MEEKFIWYIVLIVSLSFIAGILTAKMRQQVIEKPVPVVVEKPVVKIEYIDRHDTVKLVQVKKIPDTVHHTTTLTIHDTVEVIVPIYVQLYDTIVDDVRVEAKISGFNPSLDMLTVTNLRICPQINSGRAPGHFGIGINIGYGFVLENAPERLFSLHPYIGVGVHYNLVTF